MSKGKKCIPGVVCIENLTLGFLVIITVIAFGFMYVNATKKTDGGDGNGNGNGNGGGLGRYNPFTMFFSPNVPYTNIPGDVYSNPYTAPLKDTRYMVPSMDIRAAPEMRPDVMHMHPPMHGHGQGHGHGMPINVPTHSVDTHYRQVGILTRADAQETILPLMGRPLFVSRDKWQYYTLSDKNNSVKLPVSAGGRSCTGEYGCSGLGNGDSVYVEGYNDSFKVTMYDNATINYIPYI